MGVVQENAPASVELLVFDEFVKLEGEAGLLVDGLKSRAALQTHADIGQGLAPLADRRFDVMLGILAECLLHRIRKLQLDPVNPGLGEEVIAGRNGWLGRLALRRGHGGREQGGRESESEKERERFHLKLFIP